MRSIVSVTRRPSRTITGSVSSSISRPPSLEQHSMSDPSSEPSGTLKVLLARSLLIRIVRICGKYIPGIHPPVIKGNANLYRGWCETLRAPPNANAEPNAVPVLQLAGLVTWNFVLVVIEVCSVERAEVLDLHFLKGINQLGQYAGK